MILMFIYDSGQKYLITHINFIWLSYCTGSALALVEKNTANNSHTLDVSAIIVIFFKYDISLWSILFDMKGPIVSQKYVGVRPALHLDNK